MALVKLSTKLTWGIVILMTMMVILTSLGIVYGVYKLTEQQIKSSLMQDLKVVLTEHLTIENDQIKQRDKDDNQALGAYLRTKDLSALIVDENGEVLARYGIYRDLDDEYLKITPVTQGLYQDLSIEEYGLLDIYSAPIKSSGKVYGYLAMARKNVEMEIIKKTIMAVAVILLPLAWGISLIVAYMMAKQITLPMTRLVEYLEKIKMSSMQPITESSKMDYEVSVVVKAINDLIHRLKANLARERQITENISHEFKTPLTRIASNLQVGRVKEAEQEVLALGGNVDALLTLAIWEDSSEQCDIIKIINHLIKLVPSNLKVSTILPKKMMIPLPSSHAMIVIRNILDNAIKHNIKDGYIKVLANTHDGEWNIEVRNSCKASTRDVTKIIARKYKFGQSGGHGIGMSIVSQMCELHKLNLEIEEVNCEMLIVISA